MKEIHKVGAIVLKDKKLLVVKKYDKKIYTSLGGKPEPGETIEQTLIREIKEETGSDTKSFEFFGKFSDNIAIFDKDASIIMDVYMVELEQEPEAQAEIEEIKWIDRNFKDQGVVVGSLIEKHMIPELVKRGLM